MDLEKSYSELDDIVKRLYMVRRNFEFTEEEYIDLRRSIQHLEDILESLDNRKNNNE